MKFLILCVAVIAFAVITVGGYAEKYSVGIRIAYIRNTPLECQKSGGPECSDDCSTLMLCSKFSKTPLLTTQCTAPNRYCVDGACTSNPGTKCSGSPSSGFQCLDVGIFPDPADCTQYYVCDSQGASKSAQCYQGFVFNSKLKMCQRGKSPCSKISCSKASEANTFISYASNPAYYAYCTKDDKGEFQTLMFKCPYEDFEVFDMKTKECKFKCKARGNFQNPADCRQYYYCSGVNAQPISGECPENWIFDGVGCNSDADKCLYKPTTTITATTPELSVLKPKDTIIENLIHDIKSELIPKICVYDSAVCDPLSPPNDLNVAVDGYRTLTDGNVVKYIVSLTITTNSSTTPTVTTVHVKIKSDPTENEVLSVENPDPALADITKFN